MAARDREAGAYPLAATGYGNLYGYIYALMLSRIVTGLPLLGGALYMCGRVAATYFGRYADFRLSRRVRMMGSVGLMTMLLLNLALLAFYPVPALQYDVWLMFAVILTMTLRDVLGRRMIRHMSGRQTGRSRDAIIYLCMQGVLHITGIALLVGSVSGADTWMLTLGYVVAAVGEIGGQLRGLNGGEQDETELVQDEYERVRRANAYSVYEMLLMLVIAAQQVTLVMMYTVLAITAEQLVICMALAVACTFLARIGTERLRKRMHRRRLQSMETDGSLRAAREPINVLVIGLFLWIYGLIIFGRMIERGAWDMTSAYFCLGLCTVGATICLTCLDGLQQVIQAVAAFAAGKPVQQLAQLRRNNCEMAVLLGQMLALATLTAFGLLSNGSIVLAELTQKTLVFHPLLMAPALLTVLGALVAALRFPLAKRYMEKLYRFLNLKEEGGENPALQKQLEKWLLRRHTQPLFTRVLMALLRPVYRHRVKGTEHIVQDEDNPTVFLCNHGELYGPIVAMLFMPVPVRPWTISEMSVHKDEVAEYVYRFTISRQKWLPKKLQMPVARLIGPLSVWVMKQLETIPVFRNKVTKLMTTFRMSVEALEAGDNLLIFPENPDADAEKAGYKREGVGEFFEGFVLLAQMYYRKTGKCCRFQPMFGHKNMRTLTFCPPVMYEPDNNPEQERARIVDYARSEMLRVWAQEEALWQQKQGKTN